jgi:uncharacterized membrane protein YhaH (DUF805 family)
MESSNPYRTPSTDVRAPSAGGVDLTGPFDPKGRFGRLSYIAWAVAISFALNLVELVLGAGLGLAGVQPEAGGPGGGLIMAITLLLSLAAVVATVLFFIRRLHDIDLSGSWALLGLVPTSTYSSESSRWSSPAPRARIDSVRRARPRIGSGSSGSSASC